MINRTKKRQELLKPKVDTISAKKSYDVRDFQLIERIQPIEASNHIPVKTPSFKANKLSVDEKENETNATPKNVDDLQPTQSKSNLSSI